MGHRDVLETWFRRVWNERDLEAVTDMLRPDTRVEGLYKPAEVGPEQFRAFAEAIHGQLSDIRIDIHKCMEEEDWAFALISVSAKSRHSGEPVSFSGQVLVRIEDGRIVEGYNHMDFIKMYEDLQLLPEGTLGQCLSGERLSVA